MAGDLRELLTVRRVTGDTFVAEPPGEGFLFGGLTLGLALRGAGATVASGLVPKSLHAYFVRSGEWGPATTIEVERVSDTRSFSTRQVTVAQQGRTLAVVATSFHRPAPGGHWHVGSPETATPESLAPAPVFLPDPGLVEVRPVEPGSGTDLSGPAHPYWARPTAPIGEDPLTHCASLAFVSDYMVILSMLAAGPEIAAPTGIRTLDHSLWFHRPVNAEDWLLYSADPVSIAAGRGLAGGSVRTRAGTLVASFAQEVVLPS